MFNDVCYYFRDYSVGLISNFGMLRGYVCLISMTMLLLYLDILFRKTYFVPRNITIVSLLFSFSQKKKKVPLNHSKVFYVVISLTSC